MIDRDMTAIEGQLAALSHTVVAGPVGQALGGARWDVPQWRHTRIHLSAGPATGGIYRLAGTADRGSQQRDWSIILKVVVPRTNLERALGQPLEVNLRQQATMLEHLLCLLDQALSLLEVI